MSLNKFFYAVASLLLIVAAFTFASPFFISPDLIYPLRVDSMYVKYEAEQSAKAGMRDSLGKTNSLLFSPASLGMEFEKFDVKTSEGLILRGWYATCHDEDANTLIMLHDLSQSKINYLNMFKQMHDRGLNVCAIDMRAHGNSDGDEFSPGMVAVSDLRNVFSQLMKKSETNHLAVFGSGIGAAIAIQAASLDGRCEVLIAQNTFNNFSDYVDHYSKRRWGKMSFLLHAVLKRELEKRLQYNLRELNLSEIIKYVKVPTLFICGENDEIVQPIETYSVYDSSGAEEKNLILVKKAGHNNVEQLGGEEYYNAMAQFIVNAIPKKLKETRFKKLAAR